MTIMSLAEAQQHARTFRCEHVKGTVIILADRVDEAVCRASVDVGASHVVILAHGEAWLVEQIRQTAKH